MNNPVLMAERPSISELWSAYGFKTHVIAILTGVSEEVIQAMLIYQPVKREYAQKVLDKLSVLFRKECTFETVYVPLTEE